MLKATQGLPRSHIEGGLDVFQVGSVPLVGVIGKIANKPNGLKSPDHSLAADADKL
jgi:hypothetical protein